LAIAAQKQLNPQRLFPTFFNLLTHRRFASHKETRRLLKTFNVLRAHTETLAGDF